VYRYVWARLRDTQEAEDVTASTFLEAMSGLAGYTEQGRFAPWLFTIARRQVMASGKRQRPSDPLETDQPAPRHGASLELRDEIERGLACLDDTSREAVILRFFADLPVRDVALLLGKGESATKMVLHRALARMRSEMADGH
jgi:RNA polymerase sigma-70 factor (ECF subfamily)